MIAGRREEAALAQDTGAQILWYLLGTDRIALIFHWVKEEQDCGYAGGWGHRPTKCVLMMPSAPAEEAERQWRKQQQLAAERAVQQASAVVAAAAKQAAAESKFEEEAEITRQLLIDIEVVFAGQKAYYYELLRMLPPALIPKLVDDEATNKDEAGPAGGTPPLAGFV